MLPVNVHVWEILRLRDICLGQTLCEPLWLAPRSCWYRRSVTSTLSNILACMFVAETRSDGWSVGCLPHRPVGILLQSLLVCGMRTKVAFSVEAKKRQIDVLLSFISILYQGYLIWVGVELKENQLDWDNWTNVWNCGKYPNFVKHRQDLHPGNTPLIIKWTFTLLTCGIYIEAFCLNAL